jgi:ABC-type polysaccharide/polyol phosphate export permease
LAWLVPFVALGLQLLATQGLGLLVAPLATLAPDLRPALASALTLLTFASPILYPESLARGWLSTALGVNPFTHLLRLYRFPLEPLTAPELLLSLGVAFGAALVMSALGQFACSRLWWSARDAL